MLVQHRAQENLRVIAKEMASSNWLEISAEELRKLSLTIILLTIDEYLRFAAFQNKLRLIAFANKFRQQVVNSHEELKIILKDESMHESIWFVLQVLLRNIGHANIMALLEYKNLREKFLQLKDRDAVFDASPAMALWFMDDPEQRAWVLSRLTVDKLMWINQHYPEKMFPLLQYESVANIVLGHPIAFKKFASQIVDGVYYSYFHNLHGMHLELALKKLQPLANSKLNPEPISRHRANFYSAKLHVDQREFNRARTHLNTLANAKEALDSGEHEEVVFMHKQVQQEAVKLAVALKPHFPQLDAEAREIHESQVKIDLERLLKQLSSQLKKYLTQRDTKNFFFKNVKLSENKNEVVKAQIKNIDDALRELSKTNSLEDVSIIAQKASNQFLYANYINTQLHNKYARAIDGKGTLGGQFIAASKALQQPFFTIYQNEETRTLGFAS